MPNQLQITDIHIENTDADTATVATDRPVGEKDLATLGVAETFLAASKFEGKIGQTALLHILPQGRDGFRAERLDEEGVRAAPLLAGGEPVSYTHLTLPTKRIV